MRHGAVEKRKPDNGEDRAENKQRNNGILVPDDWRVMPDECTEKAEKDSAEITVSQRVTMYTTPWCGFCRRLKGQLAREGIEVAEIDIERDPAAADYVMSVNGGMQTVPTVLFPDGTALTNPSAVQVRERLTASL